MKNGIVEGYWKEFYENGKPKSVTFYINDLENGEYLSWYENGQLKEKGNYINGERWYV